MCCHGTFDLERHRTPEKCHRIPNKGIYTDISQNAIAIRAESARNNPERRKQSAAEDPARTVSRYHAGADRSSYAPYQPEQPEPTAKPRRPNQPEPITPNRSSLSRSASAGFFDAIRSGECAAGSHLPYLSCQESAFCEFFGRIAPNYCYAQLLKQEKPRIC